MLKSKIKTLRIVSLSFAAFFLVVLLLPLTTSAKMYNGNGVDRGRDFLQKHKPFFNEKVEAEYIGSPSKAQFPLDNPIDAWARQARDMQFYDGKIYIGSGDILYNRGPINLWTIDIVNEEEVIESDITLPEEQLDSFSVIDNRLLVPGLDADGGSPSQMYFKDGENWTTSSPTGGHHVNNVHMVNGVLYAYIAAGTNWKILESFDDGANWRTALKGVFYEDYVFPWRMVTLDQNLAMMSYCGDDMHDCVYKYNNDATDENIGTAEIYEDTYLIFDNPDSYGAVWKEVSYKDGILYTSKSGDELPDDGLFFLSSLGEDAIAIDEFKDDYVVDIIVRKNWVFVMTNNRVLDEDGVIERFDPEIYVSPNLKTWFKIASFSVPSIPLSFELMDGYFYVGLGVYKDPVLWPTFDTDNWMERYSGNESGSIYKINPASRFRGLLKNISRDSLLGNGHNAFDDRGW